MSIRTMAHGSFQFPEAAEVANTAFGYGNRALLGIEVAMTERLPDGSTKTRTVSWGEIAADEESA